VGAPPVGGCTSVGHTRRYADVADSHASPGWGQGRTSPGEPAERTDNRGCWAACVGPTRRHDRRRWRACIGGLCRAEPHHGDAELRVVGARADERHARVVRVCVCACVRGEEPSATGTSS